MSDVGGFSSASGERSHGFQSVPVVDSGVDLIKGNDDSRAHMCNILNKLNIFAGRLDM